MATHPTLHAALLDEDEESLRGGSCLTGSGAPERQAAGKNSQVDTPPG